MDVLEIGGQRVLGSLWALRLGAPGTLLFLRGRSKL